MACPLERRRSSGSKASVRCGYPVLPWDPIQPFRRKNQLNVMQKVRWVILAVSIFAFFSVSAFSQTTDVNDVHVQPRQPEPPKEAPPLLVPPTTNKLSAHVRPLKVDVDLVLVPVTITDPMNRLVTGLEKENFQLFAGNAAQEIRTFSSEDAPVSLGV